MNPPAPHSRAARTARALNPRRFDWDDIVFRPEELPVPDNHPTLPGLAPATDSEMPSGLPIAPLPLADPIPARMLNEFVYCPRLFYYEFVEGVFVESGDTERGAALHEKVDRGRGDLPAPNKAKRKQHRDQTGQGDLLIPDDSAGGKPAPGAPQPSDPPPAPEREEAAEAGSEPSAAAAPPDTIHSRSAMLGSDRLGVVAKMDLIEVRIAAGEPHPLEVQSVTPVDYKAGAPRTGSDVNELWDTDRMQLGAQILILRDNGYACDDGVIYYRATRQRVRLAMTAELESWIVEQIAAAREAAARRTIPPPLEGSPKCVRCSLAPVCLPDETRLLAGASLVRGSGGENPSGLPARHNPPRRLIAARDDARALYLNTPGLTVGRKDEIIVVKDAGRVVDEVRLADLSHVGLFGNIQITTQTVQLLCEREIPLAYFSMGGWFYGITRGHGLKNVFTRVEQFRAAGDPARCLALARRFVQGKIRNHRTMLMRLHREPPAAAVHALKESGKRVTGARSLEELLGMEGAAAALYFQHFAGMIKAGSGDEDEDDLPGLERSRDRTGDEFTFDFARRTRRPPTDPVNALLSLAYSLLAKDCTIAALAVGFDPYVGFFHQPRFGRPALALDLMEEFRPLIAESTVLTAINNRMINPAHFVRAGAAVNLSPAGRKNFFLAYEQRMNALITHPVFDYKVSYRRVLELQARLLARYLTGEIPDYIPMITR